MPSASKRGTLEPYLQDPDLTLYQGDVREVLAGLPDESVQMCVTSPPYWGLRDYGTEGQIGLEQTPEAFVAAMVGVFREVRRVLRRDGTLWLNLGDSYAGSGPSGASYQSETTKRRASETQDGSFRLSKTLGERGLTYAEKKPIPPPGLKAKDLCMIPARVALALQADGWYLRSEITWCKPNPMPESVTDRPTQATEKLYLLTRSPRYFYDAEAVREPAEWARWGDQTYSPEAEKMYGARIKPRRKSEFEGVNGRNVQATNSEAERRDEVGGTFNNNPRLRTNVGRNLRNWWEIATEPMSERAQTVRRVREEPGAGVGGKRRIASPDCPVHGDRPAPAATPADGGREAFESSRTERSGTHLAREQLDGPVPTDPNREPAIALDSSDSPRPGDSPTATARSKGTRKTASRSTSGDTACAETPARTGNTSPSSESPATDGSGSPGSSETPDHTARTCTCEWEYTESTSHFAAFPTELVRRCVLAGTSERGCCPECGAPWVREVERPDSGGLSEPGYSKFEGQRNDNDRRGPGTSMSNNPRRRLDTTPRMIGWKRSCDHDWQLAISPCTVLDPFFGSGTTGLVARRLGRKCVGIELSPEYCALAAKRLSQLSLLAEPAA